MLITFTTEHGALVIRSEDLRRLEDTPEGCTLGFAEEGHMCYTPVLGGAMDNHNRIVADEERAIANYEDMTRRARQGYPALPVERGKAAR